MKKTLSISGILIILTLLAIACGGPAPTPTPTPTPFYGYQSLVDDLRKRGATVEELSEPANKLGEYKPGSFLSKVVLFAGARRVTVDGFGIQVYEFPDELAADTETGYVLPDGRGLAVPGLTIVDPYDQRTPGRHYYKKGRVIVLQFGVRSVVLDDVLGPQFAGTDYRPPSPGP